MDLNFSKYVEFRISDDDMEAYLTLVSPSKLPESDFVHSVNDIFEYIQMMGVNTGIKRDVIEDIVKDSKFDMEVCVAEGLASTDGKDGSYDFKIDLNPSKTPKILPDGAVDFWNLDLIPSIGKGDLIAEYIPKTEGVSGYDIKGNVLLAKIGKDLPPFTGSGFEVSESKTLYTATRDGKVEVSGNHFNVSDVFTIKGDVDISTGNINYHGDLEINGSIKSGMSVKVSGNLTVNGTIEAANLEVTKDILVKGGIIGAGRGFINAGGNVLAKFIENAHVISEDTVKAGAILSSFVVANKKIIVEGKQGHVLGGRLKAANFISVSNIGSLSESKTEIDVGIDKFVYERQVYLVNESKRVKQEIEKIDQVIELIDEKQKSDSAEIKQKLLETKAEKISLIKRNRQEIDEIIEKLSKSLDAKIEVTNHIYPGVIIRVDSYRMDIEEEYKNVTFLRKGEQILIIKGH